MEITDVTTRSHKHDQVGLPNGAKTRFGRGKINQVKFFPDGKRLAVASSIGVWIYDSETGESLDLLSQNTAPVTAIAFSADGMRCATSSEDKTIQIWDTTTYQRKGTCIGHEDDIYYLTFNAAGNTLASVSEYSTIRIWDVDTCELLKTCLTDLSPIMTYTPDGTYLLTVGNIDSETLQIAYWETQNYEIAKEILLETNFNATAISPDQKILATGDDPLQLWELETGKRLSKNTEWVGEFKSMDFSPDGRKLVTGSRWDRVDVWDANTAELLNIMSHEDEVISVSYSPNGETIASGSDDGSVKIWDANTGKLRIAIPSHRPLELYSVAFSPDGKTLTCGGENEIHWWDLQSSEQVRNTRVEQTNVYSITFSVDGTMLATHTGNKVRLWDVETGRFLGSFRGNDIEVSFSSISLSPDCTMLATGTRDNKVCIWDIRNGELYLIGDCLMTFNEHTDEVNTVTFSPDGKILASGSNDKTIKIWDIDSQTLLRTLTGHEKEVRKVAFSSDGKTIVSGSADGTIRFWNAATGDLIRLPIDDAGNVTHLAGSPNGKLLANSSMNDKVVHIWDAHTGEHLQTFIGHTQDIHDVVFSPDSETVASVSSDGTVLLWDIKAL